MDLEARVGSLGLVLDKAVQVDLVDKAVQVDLADLVMADTADSVVNMVRAMKSNMETTEWATA